MHSEEHDSFLSKLINTIDGEFKFVMEIPDPMINDAIKQSAGYKVYQSKKKNSTQEVNISSKPKKDVVPRRKRTITYAHNLLETEDEVVLLVKSVSTEEQRHKVVYEEMYDIVERAATTTTGLDAEQDKGSELRHQQTMGDATAQTRKTKTTRAKEIANSKKRVKRLEKKKKSRSHGLKRLYKVRLSARVDSSAEEESLGEEKLSKQGRIKDIDANSNITLVNDQEMFDADRDLQGEEVTEDITTADIQETISTAAPITIVVTDDELTMAQALVEIKKSKPKELSETPTKTTIPKSSKVQDKEKGIMVEEPLKMKKKDQISFDEQEARRLQVKFDEQDKIAKEKAQLIEDENLPWDNVQAMMDADYELATRLQEEEQGELTIEEKSRLFVELMDKRKKHFAKLKAEEKRRKPLIKAQKRNQMCVYLKNMVGFTHNQLTNKSFDEVVQKEPVKSLNKKVLKKQRIEEENESAELKRCLEIVPDDGDDVTIDAIPLSTKSPTIVDYKIYKEGRKNIMWRNQQGLAKVINWKLFNSCEVYCVTMQNTMYILLVEKMYPLTKNTLQQMWNDVRLQVDYECEMAYDLLRLVRKHIMEGYYPKVIFRCGVKFRGVTTSFFSGGSKVPLDKEPTLKKKPHNDQDPPNDRKGEKRSKRRKHKHPNTKWFTKKSGSVDDAKERKSNWFDILLKSNIDQDEDYILGLLTVTVAKKDELTIADLEGVGLEMLKRQYKNYVELEYHRDEVHKFCNGTLLKVQDNFLKMLKENKLGRGNVKLNGREWTKNDIKISETPDLQKNLEDYNAYNKLEELKNMFQQQADQELFESFKAFHAWKTMVEVHAMLKLAEKVITKKIATLVVLEIRGGKIKKRTTTNRKLLKEMKWTVESKWLFKKKTDMDRNLDTFKSRLMAKVQLKGFVDPKYPKRVCKLQRSIYGLKRASMSWNKRFDEEIKKVAFTQNLDDPCVYQKASGSIVAFLILYVDDILIIGIKISLLQDVKSWLGKCFAMKYLGEPISYVGATRSSSSKPSTGKADFHHLESDNMFEGVQLSILMNVFQT
nr:retrotransposon protein, putative, Ty1-copia subclass [Tanacetum cinerariifolium]